MPIFYTFLRIVYTLTDFVFIGMIVLALYGIGLNLFGFFMAGLLFYVWYKSGIFSAIRKNDFVQRN